MSPWEISLPVAKWVRRSLHEAGLVADQVIRVRTKDAFIISPGDRRANLSL